MSNFLALIALIFSVIALFSHYTRKDSNELAQPSFPSIEIVEEYEQEDTL